MQEIIPSYGNPGRGTDFARNGAFMIHFSMLTRRIFASAAFVLLAGIAVAQSTGTQPKGAVDSHIAAALKQVSAQRIQATIEKLVSFGTRLTISAQDPASGHGIGAAREWIKSEFE